MAKDPYVYDRHRKLEQERAAFNRAEADRIEHEFPERAKQLRNEADIIDPPVSKGEA